MPCMSYDDGATRDAINSGRLAEAMVTMNALLKNNDTLARIACKVLDRVSLSEDMFRELMKDKEIAEWYTRHKNEDKKQQKMKELQNAKEVLKKQAVAKLSPEELAAFGLDSRGNKK